MKLIGLDWMGTGKAKTKREMERGRTGMVRESAQRAHGRDKEMKRIRGGE
jgi:hypothetical protein